MWISLGVMDPVQDAELIFGSILAARHQNNVDLIGDGIRRRAWSLDSFAEQQMKSRFRFTKDQIRELMDALDFPGDDYWILSCGSRFTREEAITFYLRRLSYPNTLLNLAEEGFPAQRSALSQLHKLVSAWLYNHHTYRLLQTGLTKWVERVPMYADRVRDYTEFDLNIFGFVDGTSRAICRPGYFQNNLYSGHKKHHVLQFLSVTGPDGMILYTYGPTDKVHNDNWFMHACEMSTELLPSLHVLLDEPYGIYGDPIFGRTEYVSRGFPRAQADAMERNFNKRMNAARVSIENIFACVVNLWQWLDFKRHHKLHGTSPAREYLNAQFLTNVHNCMNPNQVSQMFECQPPSLREYLELKDYPGAFTTPSTLW